MPPPQDQGENVLSKKFPELSKCCEARVVVAQKEPPSIYLACSKCTAPFMPKEEKADCVYKNEDCRICPKQEKTCDSCGSPYQAKGKQMKEIPLTKGKYAIIDNEDFDKLNAYKWHFNGGYAKRQVKGRDWRHQGTLLMHRVIMNAPKGLEVDHINGDPLDNRKKNLRVCTHLLNAYNKKAVTGTSKYRGVGWHKASKRWRVRIKVGTKSIGLGNYLDEKSAAIAYNQAAKKYHGEYARFNTI